MGKLEHNMNVGSTRASNHYETYLDMLIHTDIESEGRELGVYRADKRYWNHFKSSIIKDIIWVDGGGRGGCGSKCAFDIHFTIFHTA